MAVTSMRSGTYVHPGEQMSCMGCHEDKWKSTCPPSSPPLAMRRPPSPIEPDVDGSRPLTFARLAQPVFETRCTPCHRERGHGPIVDGTRISNPDPSARHQSNAGYYQLEPWAFYFHADTATNHNSKEHGGSRCLPGKFGAAAAPLLKYLDQSHYGVSLTAEEFHRITLWLDANSMELGSYSMDVAEIDRQLSGGAWGQNSGSTPPTLRGMNGWTRRPPRRRPPV